MSTESNIAESTTTTAFDALPLTTRSAILAYAQISIRDADRDTNKPLKPDFMKRVALECQRIASNPNEVAAIVNAQERTSVAR